ncbi:MAG: LUD domain-containing protein [Syntrophaceae bacterium]|nr:LUD domain-containing protein [Syntrophaceae bacterium]
MDPIKTWYAEDRGKRAVEALKKRGFTAFYVENQDQAKEMTLKEIPPGAVVAVGGSGTIRGLKIIEDLRARGHKVLDHWEVPYSRVEESFQIRRAQQTSDVFLTSSNAITL